MKIRGFISWCALLLWFVGTHHCVLETLVSEYNHQPNPHTATTSTDSSSPFNCPCHDSNDSSSHSEGKTCGTALKPTSSSQIQDAARVALIPITNTFLLVLNNVFNYQHSFNFDSNVPFEITNLTPLYQRAYSLSIAPNAPPVTFA